MGAKFLANLLLLPAAILASPADAESVHFRNATWPPTPLQLSRAASGQTIAEQASLELSGELYLPPGAGRFPAVVSLHGCGGRLTRQTEEAFGARFAALGYAILFVDSFGPRGVKEGCTGPGASVDRLMDAYGALVYLASRPFIDPDRIAVIGYSQGAMVALAAVALDGAEVLFKQRFKAAIAYYPACSGYGAVAAPTLVLIGQLDDWTPARDCEALMARRNGLGAPMRVIVYPGAHHAFNFNGRPRDYYGHHLEFNEAAARAAWVETVGALRAAFGK
jgi:dienelactone hydrolase